MNDSGCERSSHTSSAKVTVLVFYHLQREVDS